MLIYFLPAKYAPEVERAVRAVVQSVRLDDQFRRDGKRYLEPAAVDESRTTGTITIAIGVDREAASLPVGVIEPVAQRTA